MSALFTSVGIPCASKAGGSGTVVGGTISARTAQGAMLASSAASAARLPFLIENPPMAAMRLASDGLLVVGCFLKTSPHHTARLFRDRISRNVVSAETLPVF
jgi:hypothetical protein